MPLFFVSQPKSLLDLGSAESGSACWIVSNPLPSLRRVMFFSTGHDISSYETILGVHHHIVVQPIAGPFYLFARWMFKISGTR